MKVQHACPVLPTGWTSTCQSLTRLLSGDLRRQFSSFCLRGSRVLRRHLEGLLGSFKLKYTTGHPRSIAGSSQGLGEYATNEMCGSQAEAVFFCTQQLVRAGSATRPRISNFRGGISKPVVPRTVDHLEFNGCFGEAEVHGTRS